MESQFTSAGAGAANVGMGGGPVGIMGRFNTMEGFGANEFGSETGDRDMPMPT